MAHQLFQDPMLFEAGDRLTPEEFLARWECMPNLKFAELINGVVYLPSPVSPGHARSVHLIDVWAGLYALRTGISEVLPNVTWLMEKKSVPQPDIALRIKPEYGGTSSDTETYPAGPPEFVAEVSRSTRSYDLGPKLELYERAGVREYLAALLEEQRLEWRILENGKFQLMSPSEGVFRSKVFPGLWLDQLAFWNNDLTAILARLEQGLQSAEFQQFRESRQRR